MNLLKDSQTIFRSGLKRVDPAHMVRSAVSFKEGLLTIETDLEHHTVNLQDYDELIVIGAGKASLPMAAVLEEILGDTISEGLVFGNTPSSYKFQRIRCILTSHPVPDSRSEEAGRLIYDLCRRAGEKTLILNLISGGGSAIVEYPFTDEAAPLTLGDIRLLSEKLLATNATIQEINCVRKHLSGLKGGRLAEISYPARTISLILSDVVGDPLDAVSSGPTVQDETTYGDAVQILRDLRLWKTLPAPLRDFFQAGLKGRIAETPGIDAAVFDHVTNLLIGSNLAALNEAKRQAEELGYHTRILSSQLTGEAREVAKIFSALAKDLRQGRIGRGGPACILAGGETTVTLRGSGRGGRNQEMALSFLDQFVQNKSDMKGTVFLSSGTDGKDGPTDVAGAVIHKGIYDRAAAARLKTRAFLDNNDSHRVLSDLDALFYTGPTETNVCDIQILLVDPSY